MTIYILLFVTERHGRRESMKERKPAVLKINIWVWRVTKSILVDFF